MSDEQLACTLAFGAVMALIGFVLGCIYGSVRAHRQIAARETAEAQRAIVDVVARLSARSARGR